MAALHGAFAFAEGDDAAVMVGEDQLRFPVNGYQLSAQGGDFISNFFKNFASKICDPTLRDKVD